MNKPLFLHTIDRLPMKFHTSNKEEMLPEDSVFLHYRRLQQQFVWYRIV